MKPAAARPKTRRRYHRHGFHALSKAVGSGSLDGRSALARALASWRGEIEAALGGPDQLSPQEATLLQLAAGDAALVALADAEIARLGDRVIAGRGAARRFVALVADRQRVASSLAERLRLLGLKRRPKPAPSLREAMEAARAKREASGPEPEAAA
jgi:hypothetical protein